MTQKIQPRAQPVQIEPKNAESKSFSDHISELRRRAFFVALVFMAASSLAYNYRDFLVTVIMKPLGDEKLIYLTPGGGFNFIFQITLYAGLIVAAPMLIYQLYGFIRPALPPRAQRSAGKVVIASFVLMLLGVTYGYFVAVPSALNFLSTFAGTNIAPSLTADSYLGFFLAYIAGLGVLFQLPLLLLFVHWIRPMTPGKLLKSEKFVILFAFIAAALITPTPDVLNQSMIAVPLIAIYQLGVIVVLLTISKEHRKAKKSIASTPVQPTKPEPVFSQLRLARPAVPSATTEPAPLKQYRSMPAVSQHTTGRGIDGFGRATRPATIRMSPPPRQVVSQQPVRPLTRPTMPHYRRPMSIDGFMIG